MSRHHNMTCRYLAMQSTPEHLTATVKDCDCGASFEEALERARKAVRIIEHPIPDYDKDDWTDEWLDPDSALELTDDLPVIVAGIDERDKRIAELQDEQGEAQLHIEGQWQRLVKAKAFFDAFGFDKHPPELAQKLADMWAAERLHPAHTPRFMRALVAFGQLEEGKT